MAKFLAIAYGLTIIALSAMVGLGRGAIPSLDGITTLVAASLCGLLLIPASALFFVGARRSVGAIRKLLAYGLTIGAGLGGVSCVVALLLVVLGAVKAG